MNLILLFDDDFIDDRRARLTGRRLEHVTSVHRAAIGDAVVVGVMNGKIGSGTVTRIDRDALEMRIELDRDPPEALPVTLVLALPRPKVLNRVIASATSMGVKRIYLINAWRVEKSYWKSPRLSDDNLHLQRVLGLEQARDTGMPSIEMRRLFRPFVEDELPSIVGDSLALVAHPGGAAFSAKPRPATIAIGPEGGFIEQEIASLERAGFLTVSLGERILRVETAVATLIARVL